jgi:hypothetical protein
MKHSVHVTVAMCKAFESLNVLCVAMFDVDKETYDAAFRLRSRLREQLEKTD